jgi:glycosyltransferase involved in cell wall biosynthesis
MLLVPPRDPTALAEAIRTALSRREELSATAREAARAHFSLDACGRQTVEAYAEALAA